MKTVQVTILVLVEDECENPVETVENVVGEWGYLARKGLADELAHIRGFQASVVKQV